MGHILSRALRRISQCGQSRIPDHQQGEQSQLSRDEKVRPTSETIPVGQSIDSAEYSPPIDNPPAEQVEEAVIKIQAYVRGHLTRKALKDKSHSLPVSSQENTRNPPLGATRLEAIAEVAEKPSNLEDIRNEPHPPLTTRSASSPLQVQLTTPPVDSRGSVSPLSEAASIELNCTTPSASIDIQPLESHGNMMATVLHQNEEPRPPIDDTPITSNGGIGPLECEEVAAIRIQSAFRGYRTRKNSPYRARLSNSPSAAQVTNGTGQLDVPLLDEQSNCRLEENGEFEVSPGQVDTEDLEAAAESAIQSGRRQSRARRREAGDDQETSSADGRDISIVDELESVPCVTEDESTVRQLEPPARDQTIDDSSLGAELSLSERSGPQVEDFSAALVSNSSVSQLEQPLVQRPSLGTKSDLSVELDTDSSNLGALLSVNEESSLGAALEPVDGDVSFSTECDLEAAATQLEEALAAEQRKVELAIHEEKSNNATEESPRIITEPQDLSDDTPSGSGESPDVQSDVGARLLRPDSMVGGEEQQSTSGRSSGCGSSEEEHEDEDTGEPGGQGTSEQVQAKQSGRSNRKRANRRKRAGARNK